MEQFNETMRWLATYTMSWSNIALMVIGGFLISLGILRASSWGTVDSLLKPGLTKKGKAWESGWWIYWLLGLIVLWMGIVPFVWGPPNEILKENERLRGEVRTVKNEKATLEEEKTSLTTAQAEQRYQLITAEKKVAEYTTRIREFAEDNQRLIGAGHLPAKTILSPDLEAMFRAASETGRKVIERPVPALHLQRTDVVPEEFEKAAEDVLKPANNEKFVLETITLFSSDGKTLPSAIVTGKFGNVLKRVRIELNWKEEEVKTFSRVMTDFFLVNRIEDNVRRSPNPIPLLDVPGAPNRQPSADPGRPLPVPGIPPVQP